MYNTHVHVTNGNRKKTTRSAQEFLLSASVIISIKFCIQILFFATIRSFIETAALVAKNKFVVVTQVQLARAKTFSNQI